MSVVDDFLKKMKVDSDDDYDEENEYDEFSDSEDYEDDYAPKKRKGFKKSKKKSVDDEYDDYDDSFDDSFDDDYETTKSTGSRGGYAQTSSQSTYGSSKVTSIHGGVEEGAVEVCMIMPKTFEDANTIADQLIANKAVVLNLEGIDMSSAQRIIDFASGACYTVGGNLQKISKKIFIVVPQAMSLSGDFDTMIGDMIDLNNVNMMK